MFLITSVIGGIYDRRAERSLAAIRDYADTLPPGSKFLLNDFVERAKLPSERKLKFTQEDLETLLDTQYWHPRAYVLLSLLHGHHALHQHAFDKDHIHPNAGFDDLGGLQLGPAREAQWRDLKDRLPNLQLLQVGTNIGKSKTPFRDWVLAKHPDELKRRLYLEQNDVPEAVSLKFEDFETFYAERRKHLRLRLAKLLNVTLGPKVTPSREVVAAQGLAESK